MAFYLYMQQKGEGCDYTIGCAQKLIKLKSTIPDKEGLKKEVLQLFEDYGIGDDRTELKQFLILCDVDGLGYSAWLAEYVDEIRALRAKAIRKKKEEELARLKRELGE